MVVSIFIFSIIGTSEFLPLTSLQSSVVMSVLWIFLCVCIESKHCYDYCSGEKLSQIQSQGQHQRPGQGSAGQPHRGQGQRKNQQGQVPQNERPRSGQGQGKQNQRGASQAQGPCQGQGQNKKQSQNKTGQKKVIFFRF